MNRFSRIGVTLIAIVVVVTCLPNVIAQRRFYSGQRNPLGTMRRIESLERRVSELERMVGRLAPANAPATTSVTVETAQQRVDAAQQRLNFTQRLYDKGYVSQAEWQENQYELSRARKVLQIARARRDGKSVAEIETEIEILDAERFLTVAKRELQLAEQFATKGLTGSNIEAHQQAVEEAKRRLDEARANAP